MGFQDYTVLHPQTIDFQEGASAGAFKAWDLVYTDSAGQVQLGTTGKIAGLALKDATGTQGTTIPVRLLTQFDLYAVPLNTTTAQTNVGTQGDITYTAGAQVVAVGTTTKEVQIVGLHPSDAVGTSGGRVLVRFQPWNFIAR